jgi:3-dehydroquinate synthase
MKKNGLPVRCDYPADQLARAALSDKKRAGVSITLVLPDDIGRCHLEKVPVVDLPLWFERGLNAQEALKL